jgi:hypothetical protein
VATSTKPTQTVGGVVYGKSDFAFTPDDTPSHWKLRLTSTPGGTPDAAIVGAAAAALGKGFRGQTVDIPEADRPAVVAKVRAAWKKANPDKDAEEMPEVLKAAETQTDAKAVEHTHAKSGGGKYTHSHPVSGTKAHGHAADAKDNGSTTELLPTVAALSERSPGVLALRFLPQAKLAEGEPVDYLCTGEWTFPEYNRGRPITVTRDDLTDVKRLWDENAYGQNLPIIDENHDPNRAVGWIKGLDWHPTDPDRLVAVPEWNEGCDKLVASGAYGYTSPLLLLNWRDPESGTVYPIVPGGLGLDPGNPDDRSGLALTNHPKIKRLHAKFAASETGDTQAALVAFGEVGTVFSGVAADTARALLAEGDGAPIDFAAADASADMADLPPCSWAPPYAEYNRCPGYTRVLADGDGDAPGDLPGCCRLSAQCNGYSPVPTGTVPPYQRSYYSEGTTMADDTAPKVGAPANAAPAPTPPPPDVTPAATAASPPATVAATPPATAQHSADMSEMQRMLAAETHQRERMQTEVARLGEELKRRDEDDRIRGVTVRLSELARRFPPAVLDSLAGPARNGTRDRARLLALAEHPVGIEALEAVPVQMDSTRTGATAVSLGEYGTGAEADPETAYSRLRKFAEELQKADPKLTREKAMLRASEEHPDLVVAYRAEKTVPGAAG